MAESAHDHDSDADPVEVAREIALRRLEQRDYSRAELAAYLARRGVSGEVTTEVLARLEGVGLVDDARFADAWAQARLVSRGLSSRAIAAELRTKGVDAHLIEEAVSSIDRDTEYDTAMELGRRKLRSLRGQPRQVIYRRLAGQLARKGYGPSIVVPVVRELLGELDEDTSLDD